jgi:hypothetical protein
MDERRTVKVSKYLSKPLRHQPDPTVRPPPGSAPAYLGFRRRTDSRPFSCRADPFPS